MATAATPQQAIPAQAVDLTVPNPKRTQNLSLPLMQGCEYNTEFKGCQIIVDEGFLKFNLELPSTQNIRLTLNQASMTVGGTSDNPVTITVNDYTLIHSADDHISHFHDVTYLITSQWLHQGNNFIRIQLDQNARTRVTFKSVGVAGGAGGTTSGGSS
jgi:hypothetical protein